MIMNFCHRSARKPVAFGRRQEEPSLLSLPPPSGSQNILRTSGILRNRSRSTEITTCKNLQEYRTYPACRSSVQPHQLLQQVRIRPSACTQTTANRSIDMETRKKAVMDSVKSEIALANAQELMNVSPLRSPSLREGTEERPQKANEKCFQKCISKPGTSLSRSDEVCFHSNMSWVCLSYWCSSRRVCRRVSIGTWRPVRS